MVKFGRKFFFDRVHTKKKYTLPIIIAIILIVVVVVTLLITRYFKQDKPKEVTPKVTFNKNIEIELYQELPSISEYIKKSENVDANDFEISYPDNLIITEDNSACENEEDTNCKKYIVSSLGEYEITFTSDKIKETNTVILKVVDKTAPVLTLKEVAINEGASYKLEDFIESCTDNSTSACTYEYSSEEKNENGEVIDYSKFTEPGEYTIKIIAKDISNNKTESLSTKLTIIKKQTSNNNDKNDPEKTCTYGNLKYSSAYVIATRISDSKCAISAEEANSIAYEPAIIHNRKLIKEIQSAYLKNTIDKLNLGGEIIYDITYGPVFNTTNKGVVGYYLLSEAKQTINGKTTTIARYFIDEDGNRVWKVNTLNLK